MSLPRRERRVLTATEAAVCRSDPALASMMAIFSRLAADEDMPAHERAPVTFARVLAAMMAAVAAVIHFAARAGRVCIRGLSTPSHSRGVTYGQSGSWPSPLPHTPWYWYR
jgi:Protein of unknown function (DUF3040)